jgi:hypothetical protein
MSIKGLIANVLSVTMSTDNMCSRSTALESIETASLQSVTVTSRGDTSRPKLSGRGAGSCVAVEREDT